MALVSAKACLSKTGNRYCLVLTFLGEDSHIDGGLERHSRCHTASTLESVEARCLFYGSLDRT